MFYLYALLGGTLGSQIEALRVTCKELFGVNDAHRYPVHVTLTRHFSLNVEMVGEYLALLAKHFTAVGPFRVVGLKRVKRTGLVVLELQHDLIAEATKNWALELGRRDLRIIDDRFHVTLAWNAPQYRRIFEMAQQAIDCTADVEWRVALCTPLADAEWHCYDGVPLR